VTFVNPQKTKGLYVFARVAEVLARRRPDIPLLVVEGRNGPEWTSETGIDLAALGNVTVRPNTTDPRTIYADTKLILVPSLWNESFGLVAAEGMMNGIPVLASNRGALTETVGGSGNDMGTLDADGTRSARSVSSVPALKCYESTLRSQRLRADGTRSVPATMRGGFLFDIPAKYTAETRVVPSAEEVEPWVETIIRLWDNPAEYEHCSRAAREHAQQWRPDRLAPIYCEFFGGLC
jgi:glycosyltransferase involved in cell wall biosynthesis